MFYSDSSYNGQGVGPKQIGGRVVAGPGAVFSLNGHTTDNKYSRNLYTPEPDTFANQA